MPRWLRLYVILLAAGFAVYFLVLYFGVAAMITPELSAQWVQLDVGKLGEQVAAQVDHVGERADHIADEFRTIIIDLDPANEADFEAREIEHAQVDLPKRAEPRFDPDAYAEKLGKHTIAFNVPSEIPTGERIKVVLVIDWSKEGEGKSEVELAGEVQALQERDADIGGTVETALAGVDAQMQATVEADKGLEVEAIGATGPRWLSKREQNRWEWWVRALESGEWGLKLTLHAVPDKGGLVKVTTFERKMLVSVDALGVVKDNWEWLWTFLGAPVGAYAVTSWRRRREDASTS